MTSPAAPAPAGPDTDPWMDPAAPGPTPLSLCTSVAAAAGPEVSSMLCERTKSAAAAAGTRHTAAAGTRHTGGMVQPSKATCNDLQAGGTGPGGGLGAGGGRDLSCTACSPWASWPMPSLSFSTASLVKYGLPGLPVLNRSEAERLKCAYGMPDSEGDSRSLWLPLAETEADATSLCGCRAGGEVKTDPG